MSGAAESLQEPGANGSARRESVLQRRLTLGDLLDLPSFSDVVRSFCELYRVGIKVLDARGTKLADMKVGNGDFCGLVFNQPEGRLRCSATVARLKDGPLPGLPGARAVPEVPQARGALALTCFTGLRYLVMPVSWEGDMLGRVIFGPFTPEELRELPPTLTDIAGLDLAQAQQHLTKVRRAPERTVAQVMAHFALVLGTLVAAGQKTYLTSQVHIEATLESHHALEEKNERLEAMNARLKELDKLKSSFLATVSHELRTPLTSIIVYSEMLSEGLAGPLNPEQVEYVKTIVDKGEALLKLISSILDLSQIEAGKVRLSFEPLDVGELVSSALSSVVPQAQKKGVHLTLDRPEAPQPFVEADRDKLRQVVVNLLANAVKFTASGGQVRVALSPVGPQPELGAEGYRLAVEDTGVGIPTEQFERIFQSFYQVDNSSTREFGGAGLGLAIVKSYVHGHGGQVKVASQLGAGSSFCLVLPARPARTDLGPVFIPPPVEPDRF
jgi:signal transduction histidine kinase